MNRPIARLSALLVAGGCVGAACGGKVVVDETGSTSTSSTRGAGAGGGGSTGAGGCESASHTIDIADYNVICTAAEDCIAVFLGDFCSSCSCPFSAINVADKTKYEAEAQVKSAGTPPDGCSCPASTPFCAVGQCATHVP